MGEESSWNRSDGADKQADSESGLFQRNIERLLFIPVTVRFGFNPSSEDGNGALVDQAVSGSQSACCDDVNLLQSHCFR